MIFHIQTEDSGLKAPHVFTHLFHGGVIVSTRKLVYDAGTVEEGIRELMKSQHKAVMKELRKGTFDVKIDEYLGDTPGLVPIGGAGAETVNAGNQNPLPDELGLKNAGAMGSSDSGVLRPSRDTMVDEVPVPVVAAVTPPSTPNLIPAAAAAAVAQRKGTGPLQVPLAATAQLKATLIGAGPSGESARRRTDSITPLPPAPSGRVSTEDLAGSLSTFSSTFAGNSTSEIAAPRTVTPARVMQRPLPQRPAIAPPEVHTRAATSDISVGGSDDIAEIHSPAMPSVEPPPGSNEHRSGEYAQHRRRPSSQVAPFANDAKSQSQNSRDALSALVQSGSSKPATGSHAVQQIVKPPTNPSIPAQRSPTNPSLPPTVPRPATNSSAPAQRSPTNPSIPAQRSPTSPSIPVASHRSPPAIPGSASREQPPSVGSGLATPAVASPKPVAAPPATAGVAARPRTPTPARVVPAAPGSPRRRASTGAGVVMSKPAVVVGTPSRNSPVYQGQGQTRVRSAREGDSPVAQPRAISERSLDEVILAYLSEDSKNQT